MESNQEKKQSTKQTSPRISSTVLLDFSFKTLLCVGDMIDEVKKGEITGLKRSEESGKLLCTALRLNNNNIGDLQDLGETLEALFDDPDTIEWIDLSFNDLSCITGLLDKLKNLKRLYLHGNTIDKIQEVNKLAVLPDLKSLTLHGNPIESEKGYRQFVLSTLPSLKTLDFSGVTKQDRSTAETWKRMYGGLKRNRRTKSIA
ncbi:leucine-rich repeat-containing protein 51-like [Styela clava]